MGKSKDSVQEPKQIITFVNDDGEDVDVEFTSEELRELVDSLDESDGDLLDGFESVPVDNPVDEEAMKEVFRDVFAGVEHTDDPTLSVDTIPQVQKAAFTNLNRVFNYARKPKNIVITGPHGSGKTHMIDVWANNYESLPRMTNRPLRLYRYDSDMMRDYQNEVINNYGKDAGSNFVLDIINMLKDRVDSDVENNVRPVVITAEPDMAVGLVQLVDDCSFIIESSMNEAMDTLNNMGARCNTFELLDLSEFPLQWHEMLDLLTHVNDDQLEPSYVDGLAGPLVSDFFKMFFKLLSTEGKMPHKDDTIMNTIGELLDVLEQAHAKLLEESFHDLDTKAVRKLAKNLAEETATFMVNRDDIDSFVGGDEDALQILSDFVSSDDEGGVNAALKRGKDKKPSKYSDVSTLGERLRKSIVNQDDAIDQIVNAVKIDATGLRDPRRPVGVFMFAGPSGVGKTELARQLANELYEKPANFVRIDMGEFIGDDSVNKLFGASRGYKDSDMGGTLTNAVLEDPQSVILLDEAEKAHRKVWDALLQVFDNGHMTDGLGHVADFTKSIIILTSNLGNGKASKPKSGFLTSMTSQSAIMSAEKERHTFTKEAIEQYFKIEFINRLDSIILFNKLRNEDLVRILRMQLDELGANMKRNYPQLTLDSDFSDAATEWVLDQADCENFGARELQRTIRRLITLPLADWLLKNGSSIGKRDHDIMTIDYDDVNHQASFKITKKDK